MLALVETGGLLIDKSKGISSYISLNINSRKCSQIQIVILYKLYVNS